MWERGLFALCSILGGILGFTASAWAQSSVVTPSPLSADQRAELERQLQDLESQIDAQRQILSVKQRESVSLERDIAILNAKISEAKLSIRARDLSIKKLSTEIGGKATYISQLSDKLSREQDSLAQLLRKTRELDSYSVAEIVFSSKSISDFFAEADEYGQVRAAIGESMQEVRGTRSETQDEKAVLEDKRSEQLELRRLQELQKKDIEKQEAEKKRILKVSRGIEAEYQKIIKQKETDAASIRARLFSLRGSAPIPFGQAYLFASEAEKKTGVRAAVILGIIATESNLGENVGTGSWKADMAQRDWADFQSITSELGLNPDTVPVSARPCSKAERDRIGPGVSCGYGWGGAMGPAQFIPSTWLLYKDKVAAATGSNPPNPWNPRDAFFASAILLKDNGADKGTRAAERLAALRYLAGWKNAEKKSYAFYGNQVMDLADDFQQQINVLKESGG